MNKTIVFGGSGGLGRLLQSSNIDYVYLSSKDVDLTNKEQINYFLNNRPYDIDSVINLSGININSALFKLSNSDIDSMIDVNIKGTLNLVSESVNYFKSKNIEGNIILTSSILSTNPVYGTGVYSACKSFIDSIVKTCSLENSKYGIRCNSIQLGYFDGGMTYTIGEEMLEKLKQNIPLKRYGNADELYQTIIFLQKNTYITGQVIRVSGGL